LLPGLEPDSDGTTGLDRQLSLLQTQSHLRKMTVAAPNLRSGYLPSNGNISAVQRDRLSGPLTAALGRSTLARDSLSVWWALDVNAADPSMAWALARESLVLARSSAPRSAGSLEFSTDPILVDDAEQQPTRRGYGFRAFRNYRFPVPAWNDGLARLTTSAIPSDPILAILARNLRAAVGHLYDDDPDAAFDDIVKCLDIAFQDYTPLPNEEQDKPMKRFVLKSSLLLSLNWPSDYFQYLYMYLILPSNRVTGKRLLDGERRPEHVWKTLEDDAAWSTAFARTSWDVLLDHRRRDFLEEVNNWRVAQPRRETQYNWQLARAVRSRNELFHESMPLADTHALAALIAAVDLNPELPTW